MKYFIHALILIACGCTGTHPIVLPGKNVLKVATVNHNYQDVIEIKGGAVNESSVSVSIIPNDSGLAWNPEEIKYSFGGEDGVNKNYHRIIISGIPKKSGDYRVTVSGFTLGTMYSGKDFYKQYTIKIK
ncbi:hypothetical protein [Enterobacter vonholyi]|uniref:Uncharacterized protein n=1 Tax=Enterobacter vonholyi TaxID=2797505 RepID=A0ABU6E1B1_9ENTR|nr:hypothetical protein [Enterobacter vonholyi]MEB5979706.1 hypothetical protein [Enterobacter vonholyi]MEB6410000.1 hypothetical protein [Enterobacter vonholyi]